MSNNIVGTMNVHVDLYNVGCTFYIRVEYKKYDTVIPGNWSLLASNRQTQQQLIASAFFYGCSTVYFILWPITNHSVRSYELQDDCDLMGRAERAAASQLKAGQGIGHHISCC